MRINTDHLQQGKLEKISVEVGDIFMTSRPCIWLVAAKTGGSCHCLKLCRSGAIIGTTTYGAYYLLRKKFIGRCDLEDLVVDAEWFDED